MTKNTSDLCSVKKSVASAVSWIPTIVSRILLLLLQGPPPHGKEGEAQPKKNVVCVCIFLASSFVQCPQESGISQKSVVRALVEVSRELWCMYLIFIKLNNFVWSKKEDYGLIVIHANISECQMLVKPIPEEENTCNAFLCIKHAMPVYVWWQSWLLCLALS